MTTVLITGANRGIGLELARAALKRGWMVYGSARTDNDCKQMADELGDGFTALKFDVTDHAAVGTTLAGIEGPVDILINNAGIIGAKPQSPLEMDFAGFAKTLEVNTLAPLAVAQQALPLLRKAASPRILTISSQMSWMGYAEPDRIAYRASKTAVNKVMQGLSTELVPDGIAVCVIDPGWVQTDMGGAAADNPPDLVARGIIDIADRLDMSGTGKFFKWSGEERPY